MAGSDLNAPLGVGAKPKRRLLPRLPKLPLGFIGVTLIVSILAGAVMWASLVDDPHGGEPIAVVSLDRTRGHGLSGGAVQVAEPGRGNEPVKVVDGAPAGSAGRGPADPTRIGGGATPDGPLSSAPVKEITEMGRHGPLPKLGLDGARPMDIYARPIGRELGGGAKVVIIVTGLGLSQTGTDLALKLLPPSATLAFAPYGSSLDRWMNRARSTGHEILIQLPMEPFDYPDNDPGPQTLLSSLSSEANVDRLHWVMSRMTNYAGVISHMGARFTSDANAIGPVMKEIGSRGLFYVDDGASARSLAADTARENRAPFLRSDVILDAAANEQSIDARLIQLEGLARQRGIAVGLASALPISMRKISEWAKTLENRGLVLVPASVGARGGQS
ncbi:MAG: divergent polysaccharide deacetylase family protein [Hyphomicrobiaceae bacterium]|nr:divergent polysaccharide deacetylase family protein [Hyphomicrobiaceae bacterium]